MTELKPRYKFPYNGGSRAEEKTPTPVIGTIKNYDVYLFPDPANIEEHVWLVVWDPTAVPKRREIELYLKRDGWAISQGFSKASGSILDTQAIDLLNKWKEGDRFGDALERLEA